MGQPAPRCARLGGGDVEGEKVVEGSEHEKLGVLEKDDVIVSLCAHAH